MNWYSNNFEFWEVPELGFQIVIRKQKEWSYRVFLVDQNFDTEKNINTVKDNIPFFWFEIDQWRICFWWMFVPLKYRQKWIPDLFFRILENISQEIWKWLWITKYINKPVLAKKLLGYWFNAMQDDIQAEIWTFWEIPTIRIVKWDVSDILSKVDLSWRVHPPFYEIDQEMKSTWIIIPIHTRFIPPQKSIQYKNPLLEVILNYEALLWNS